MTASTQRDRWFLTALLGVSVFNHLDRTVIGVLKEPIQQSFALNDFQFGLLGGPSFAFVYSFMCIGFGRLAERVNRVMLISGVFALWSLATALCGLATSFAMLIVFRALVGIGEAGCTPSAHSLIADRFAPERRSGAVSVFQSGIALGTLASGLGGAAIAKLFGWQATFFALGGAGMALALLFVLTLREPARTAPADTILPFGEALRALTREPMFWHVSMGVTAGLMLSLVVVLNLTSFFMQVHRLDILQAGMRVALIFGLAGALGTWAGGLLGNRHAASDPGQATRLIAWGHLLALPLSLVAFLASSALLATMLLTVAVFIQASHLGPVFASLHRVMPPRMRATAIAALLLLTNLLGYGIGLPLIGEISDRFAGKLAGGMQFLCAPGGWLHLACDTPKAGGLQLALVVLTLANLWAFWHFMRISALSRQRDAAS